MLEFHPLTKKDIDRLRPFFSENPNRLCDLTVGGVFIWRDYYKTEYAIHEGVLYFKVDYPGTGTMFTMPQGEERASAYGHIRDYCRRRGMSVKFYPIPTGELERLKNCFVCADVISDRNTFDYLYEAQALKFFPGKKLAGQRNHVNRFLRTYENWSFDELTGADTAEALAFLERYAAVTRKQSSTFAEDMDKTAEVVRDMEVYGMAGGMLRVDGRIVGLSIGEVQGDTLFVHIEKADRSVEGCYQMLVSQFAQRFAGEGVTYINREDDAGDEGLRTSKLAYKPIALLEKFAVLVQDGPCPGKEGIWPVEQGDILQASSENMRKNADFP